MRKIKIFALLLLSSAALADIGVVVRSNGTVIAREVYTGDTSTLAAKEAARQAQDPTLTFNNFVLPSAPFDATIVAADQALQTQMQNDKFNILLSTNTAAVKLQSLIDYLQLKGELQ